jgi:hypothetical protein
MEALFEQFKSEFTQYTEKPTRQKAVKIRGTLLNISKESAAQRKLYLDEAKNLPVKPRAKKLVPVETLQAEPKKEEPEKTPEPVQTPEPTPFISTKEVLHAEPKKKRVRKPKSV